MKYVVVLGDGMADTPVAELGQRTPLQCARKPNIDRLAKLGEVGLVKTVPEGMPPASDVANLSVMGYDPKKYYTGRSPLEAVSIGIDLAENDVAFRCNLVTLSDDGDYADKTMLDYSSDEISTTEARTLIGEIDRRFRSSDIAFYPGVSYRHCMVWKNGPLKCGLTPPHDISLKGVRQHLPKGPAGGRLLGMMRESFQLLKDHPVNAARRARGLEPANSIWLWGEGKRPSIPAFHDKYRLKGSVISAVDLLKGLGICAGMRSIDVEGATGNLHTNFAGKARAALRELESGQDFVYLHIEAPDECGHRHEIEGKVKAIELIDEQVVGPLLAGLQKLGDHRVLVMPDHPTPLALRTHTSDPVPFLIYRSGGGPASGADGFDEQRAKATGLLVESGHQMMDRFLGR
jgi:2,3-bisphosphoglycerate-independent phosphoglycerate mutase